MATETTERQGYFAGWTLKREGIIAPDERLPWGQSILVGLQHVLAMFGATVLGPILMGFNPNTAIFFSGIGTLIFFIIVGGRVPSYLGFELLVHRGSPGSHRFRKGVYRTGFQSPHRRGFGRDHRGGCCLCHHWSHRHIHGLQVDRVLDAACRHRCCCGRYWPQPRPGRHRRYQRQPV